jgi:phosphate transport system permease protein
MQKKSNNMPVRKSSAMQAETSASVKAGETLLIPFLARPVLRRKRVKESLIKVILFLAAFSSILVTAGIVGTLLVESMDFFKHVPLSDFLTDTQWTPLFSDPHYGIAPLICGTLVTTAIALLIAIPLGTAISVYLSEYAGPKSREILKPILELLSAVPTVVYGFFALLLVSPLFQTIFPDMGAFNMLSAGIVMGIMIVPYVGSLSEDAMRAVPASIREGSYALGSTRLQTAFRVVFPSALSGISAAYVLALSRAVGETMIVAIAAGMQPNITLDPREPASTLTAYIVQVSLGDVPHGSIGYQTIFAAGIALFVFTFSFNLLSFWLRRRYRQAY